MGISNFVLIPTVSFFSIFFPLSKMKCLFLVCCFAIAVFAAPGLRPGTKIIHHPQLGPLPLFPDRRRTSQRRFIQTVPQQQQLGPLPFFPDRRRTVKDDSYKRCHNNNNNDNNNYNDYNNNKNYFWQGRIHKADLLTVKVSKDHVGRGFEPLQRKTVTEKGKKNSELGTWNSELGTRNSELGIDEPEHMGKKGHA